jgi:hypothetical protein
MSPNAEEGGGGSVGVSANEYSCAHGAQINFGDLTPYLTYDANDLTTSMFSNRVFYSKAVWHIVESKDLRISPFQLLRLNL